MRVPFFGLLKDVIFCIQQISNYKLAASFVLQGVFPRAAPLTGAVLVLRLQTAAAAPDDLKDAVDGGLFFRILQAILSHAL